MRIRTIQRNVPRLVSKPHILPALESAGIKTTHDVLFTPLGELLNRLSGAEDILTTDIIELQDEIAASVDDLLGETLYGPYVVEISGQTGSGKSAIAMQVALRRLAYDPDAAHFGLTVQATFQSSEQSASETTTTSVLSRVQIILSFEIDEFQNTLDSIEASLTVNDPTLLHIDYSFAVIIGKLSSFPAVHSRRPDYASPLWADHRFVKPRTRNNGQYHETTRKDRSRSQFDGDGAEQNSQFAHTKSALFVSKTTAKPALGPTFTFLSHATIWLSTADTTLERRGRQGETHIVEVFRSRVGVRTFLLYFRNGSNVRDSQRTAGVCSLYRTGWFLSNPH
ncbi:DNA repair protein RAD50 [Rhizoctonia solani]|uniref:DNA repair protein RAD50 n=1 Tax=Rhizoctonia solani TaxID=456999 RepID=A0A8H8NRJ0_9AGAM|nr:DNA repair protein RAD50 [Rhizoctonia solani]QRW18020.1 DNA repair protein RAD50 [Rhizoctonia solani]